MQCYRYLRINATGNVWFNISPCFQLQNGEEMIFLLQFLLPMGLSSTGWVVELLTCIFLLQPCCSWGLLVRNQVLLNPFCMLWRSVWCPWKSVSRFFAYHKLWPPAWIPAFYTFVHRAHFLRLTFLLVWLSFNQQCISTSAQELKAWRYLLLHYTVGIPVVWGTFHNWWCALRKRL